MLAMAIGVIFSGRELKGSCGGVAGNCPCEDAGTPGACKVELDEDQDNQVQHLETKKDGVMIYGGNQS